MHDKHGNVLVYCCGGMGINAGSQMETTRNNTASGAAKLDIVYVDTSTSNFIKHKNIDSKDCFVISGFGEVDGSGKKRVENYQAITDKVQEVIKKFKPADLNIVICSASGGSGSVVAPTIVSELLKENRNVVLLMVGVRDTMIEINNTMKTLMTFENIAQMRNKPVVCGYVENSDKVSREDANLYLIHLVYGLCILFSRQNHELDSADLHNWLNYNDVYTVLPAQLSVLNLIRNGESIDAIDDVGNILSIASLLNDGESSKIVSDLNRYHCAGYLPENIETALKVLSPYHFVISDGVFGKAVSSMSEQLKELEESIKKKVFDRGILSGNNTPTKNGLIL